MSPGNWDTRKDNEVAEYAVYLEKRYLLIPHHPPLKCDKLNKESFEKKRGFEFSVYHRTPGRGGGDGEVLGRGGGDAAAGLVGVDVGCGGGGAVPCSRVVQVTVP